MSEYFQIVQNKIPSSHPPSFIKETKICAGGTFTNHKIELNQGISGLFISHNSLPGSHVLQ